MGLNLGSQRKFNAIISFLFVIFAILFYVFAALFVAILIQLPPAREDMVIIGGAFSSFFAGLA